MQDVVLIVGLGVLAYLLGSFPTGYLLVKLLKGVDIRTLGSGSTGATNVLRNTGKGPAAIVFIVDIGKGVLAVWAAGAIVHYGLNLAPGLPALQCLAGAMALVGHSRPVWLNFQGGKSVATGLGILFALNWVIGLSAFGCFGLMLAVFRIVSLGSIVAALSVNGLMWGLGQPLAYKVFALLGGSYVIWRHKGNIKRLLAGTEPRIGQPIPAEADVS
ncbi:MAG: glycerol-3-phosphate 1-O-acyltransferase PlsY [Prochlorotrichaceae cyanobacterium]|jgi:glycerol-3-phosphate acyltransferase PlsY